MHDFLLIFHSNYVSNLHHFLDIIDNFPNLKRSRDRDRIHLRDSLSTWRLILHMPNQCKKQKSPA